MSFYVNTVTPVTTTPQTQSSGLQVTPIPGTHTLDARRPNLYLIPDFTQTQVVQRDTDGSTFNTFANIATGAYNRKLVNSIEKSQNNHILGNVADSQDSPNTYTGDWLKISFNRQEVRGAYKLEMYWTQKRGTFQRMLVDNANNFEGLRLFKNIPYPSNAALGNPADATEGRGEMRPANLPLTTPNEATNVLAFSHGFNYQGNHQPDADPHNTNHDDFRDTCYFECSFRLEDTEHLMSYLPQTYQPELYLKCVDFEGKEDDTFYMDWREIAIRIYPINYATPESFAINQGDYQSQFPESAVDNDAMNFYGLSSSAMA